MSALARPDQLLEAAQAIRMFIDSHESSPFSGNDGDYLISLGALAQPREIGERTANYLVLFRAVSGSIAVGAYYQTEKALPHPVTRVRQEFPIRDILIMGEAPSTYAYDGKDIDARPYPLRAEMVKELITDIETAY